MREKTAFNKNLSLNEIQNAEMEIFKYFQSKYFSCELSCINKKSPLQKNSILKKLSPIIDEKGILRVGGRLDQANLPYDARHPIIVPSSHLSQLLICSPCIRSHG